MPYNRFQSWNRFQKAVPVPGGRRSWQSFRSLCLLPLLALAGSTPAHADSGSGAAIPVTNGTVLYNGGTKAPGSSYSRMVRLQFSGAANNNHILATFEDFDTRNFPIYESDDDGLTWSRIGTCAETNTDGYVLEWQPHMLELAQQMSDLAPGTLLLTGEANGPNGHRLELYTSTDQGHTWRFRSIIRAVAGGIWEPNLQVAADGSLMVYYSDETQSGYSQLLAEVRSTDGGKTFGAPVIVAGVQDNNKRPGMAVTAKLPNGKYIMSFESVNSASPNNFNGYSAVHVKLSNDGINWGDTSLGTAVVTASGSFLGATPYIMWSPAGGVNGTIIVSAMGLENSPNQDRELAINTNLGQGNWTMIPAPLQWQGGGDCVPGGSDHAGWSQAILPTKDGTGIIHMGSSYVGGCRNAMLYAREQLILPGTTYSLVNQKSGQAVDIPLGSTQAGAYLEQYTVNNNPAQLFNFKDLGNNTFQIINPQSNLAWDDPGGSQTAGQRIWQYTQNTATAQQWRLRPVGDGSTKFVNLASNQVLAVDGASTTPGANLTQYIDNGTPDHNWLPIQNGITSGTYKIVATTTGMVLDGSTNSNAAGKPVDLWTYWHGAFQRWYISKLGNGYYNIRTINTDGSLGTSLDATNCSGADNTQVEMYTYNNAACQQWSITPVGNNAYKIATAQARSDGTFNVLDGSNCSGAAGTNILLRPWGGGGCQQTWYLQASY